MAEPPTDPRIDDMRRPEHDRTPRDGTVLLDRPTTKAGNAAATGGMARYRIAGDRGLRPVQLELTEGSAAYA